eukprot:scaffold36200_cov63-Phaeocystis_antarctica.AAC.9
MCSWHGCSAPSLSASTARLMLCSTVSCLIAAVKEHRPSQWGAANAAEGARAARFHAEAAPCRATSCRYSSSTVGASSCACARPHERSASSASGPHSARAWWQRILPSSNPKARPSMGPALPLNPSKAHPSLA